MFRTEIGEVEVLGTFDGSVKAPHKQRLVRGSGPEPRKAIFEIGVGSCLTPLMAESSRRVRST